MSSSIGKLRGLQQLANDKGLFIMVAADHRDSLKRMLADGTGRGVGYQDMVDFKLELCRAAAADASALLLDPVYGAAQSIAAGALPGGMGLLVSMEESGYQGNKRARTTELLPGWGPEKAKRMGASAAKLLIYFRPDLEEVAAKQLGLVRKVAGECMRVDLPLLVETVSYPVTDKEDDPREFAKVKPRLVIEAARQLSELPIDVLKTEFPGDLNYEKDADRLLDYCRELDQASKHPWVLLSGGHNFEDFRKEVELACKGGASGFLAGRGLWQEVVKLGSRSDRTAFFNTTFTARLKEVVRLANTCGRPWPARLGISREGFPQPDEAWHKEY
ncbi:MAG: tagatose 1,6-diphosphate aldolase [Chloroflexi bacterium]|nr:tagatose 1,6-diphosphate aldolase [Chloroflexota bacterium]